MAVIKLYWCRGKGRDDPNQQNFGDYLSPLLVEMLSGQAVQYAPIHKADMMAIGSIMNRERKAKRFFLPRRLHVWGPGTDAPGHVFSGRHHYHAVRGYRTLEQIDSLKGQPALGDPGLLAAHWWEGRPKPAKRYRLGVIPHYVDRDHPFIQHAQSLPGVRVIDVFWPVEEVLRAIQECEHVISSSMHGLIVSDAFGVPNRRLCISSGKISDYKFADYYSVFAIDAPAPLQVEQLLGSELGDPAGLVAEYARPGLAGVQESLLRSFPAL